MIRGGTGVFRGETDLTEFKPYPLLNGQRRYEIQVDNPGWPDPLAAGTIRPRSRRVLAPNFENPYYFTSELGIERQLPNNLFITVSYEIDRGVHPNRIRDINAPLWETGIRPNPNEGQVLQAVLLNRMSSAFPQRRSSSTASPLSAGSGPQMNVFANLFNAFNMTHLGVPSGVMTSPFFLKSYNTSGNPRTLQVGMRFQF